MRSARRLLVTLAAAAVTACAHNPPPLSTTRLVVQTTPRGGVRPFVQATVAGQPMLLLLDTGTIQSMLPAGFARENKLRKGNDATSSMIVDANGRVTTMRSLRNVEVRIEGETAGSTMHFLMMPDGVTDHGIVAPQALLRRGWALVIDLAREQLTHEPEEAALARVRAEGAPLRELDWGGCRDEDLFERAHRVVSVSVNGVETKMLIDTGAESTVLARNNPALPSMISKAGNRGASAGVNSVGAGLLLDEVPIVFAETSFVLPAVVLPASSPCGHGVVGADLLRHCTIVWGWSKVWVSCRAPGAPPKTAEW